jgi:hypothetical protein
MGTVGERGDGEGVAIREVVEVGEVGAGVVLEGEVGGVGDGVVLDGEVGGVEARDKDMLRSI